MLRLSLFIPEREGGGGAPLVCVVVRVLHKRAGAGDRPAGHCRVRI